MVTSYRQDYANDIVSMQHLCLESDVHREMPLDQIILWLGTPIRLNQYLMFWETERGPVAFITWAWLNTQTEYKYMDYRNFTPEDWQSGENLWFIDYVAPYGHSKQIRKFLRHEVFKDYDIAKCRRRGHDPVKKGQIVWQRKTA